LVKIAQECLIKMNGCVASTAYKVMVGGAIYRLIMDLFSQVIFVDEV
jgi:hypothetical protein